MDTLERPTDEFTTSAGNKIVYKKYITGGESLEIEGVKGEGAKFEMKTNPATQKPTPVYKGYDHTYVVKAKKRALEFVLISFNGNIEGAVDRVLNLPQEEYEEIAEILDPIIDKKKSKSATTLETT